MFQEVFSSEDKKPNFHFEIKSFKQSANNSSDNQLLWIETKSSLNVLCQMSLELIQVNVLFYFASYN